MTSAARNRNSREHGFTLLEIVIALAILGLIVGSALTVMVYSSDERALREAASEIEVLAKRARASAILNQTPYALEFTESGVRMMPLAQALGAESAERSGGRGDVERGQPGDGASEFPLEGGMELHVRRWGARGWEHVVKRVVHIWRFDPDGLCEPLSLRLVLGKNWREDEYHPLTATIRDTQMEVR